MKLSTEFLNVIVFGAGVFCLTWIGWRLGGVLLAMSGFSLALGLAFLVLEFEHLIQYEPKPKPRRSGESEQSKAKNLPNA